MTADEAIQELAKLQKEAHGGFNGVEALKLGIEALKRLNELRAGDWGNPLELLPGETIQKK